MTSWRLRRAVLLLPLVAAGTALADGKIFTADSVLTPATVPDQQALIHFADGAQTLVIETRFQGEGERFVWVVPLPNVPEVSAVTAGLFPTLQSVFRPRIVDEVPGWAALWGAALVVFAIILYRKHSATLKAGVLFVATLFAISVLLPSLARTRSLGFEMDEHAGLTLHSSERIGSYAVATISATQPDGLIRWLSSNGFRMDEADERVIADYVSRGWAFAAVKLSREQADVAPASPHPLAFRFETDKPVYPMRLTGTQSTPVSLDLFVFGPGRAVTSHPDLTVVQSAATERRPEGAEPLDWRKRDDDHIALVHPQLCDLVPGTPVATRLSGTLSPPAMARDVQIDWASPQPHRETLYTPAGARQTLINVGVGILCAAAAALMLLANRGTIRPLHGLLLWGLVLSIILPAGYAARAWLPVTNLRPPGNAAFANYLIHNAVARKIREAAKGSSGPKLEDANGLRNALKEQLRKEQSRTGRLLVDRNNFTGRPRIEEDSPGNFGIRETEAGVEYLWYDQEGGEHVVPMVIHALDAPSPTSSSPTGDPPR